MRVQKNQYKPNMDLVDKKFGRLKAIRPTNKRSGLSVVWQCVCDCGNIYFASRCNLQTGHTVSCGCLRLENARKKKITHKIVCPYCGNRFVPDKQRQKYCDMKCYREHVQENKKPPRDNSKYEKDRRIYNSIMVTDAYCKAAFLRSGHVSSSSEVTPEMIEVKRMQIAMKRTLKQFKEWRGQNESSN